MNMFYQLGPFMYMTKNPDVFTSMVQSLTTVFLAIKDKALRCHFPASSFTTLIVSQIKCSLNKITYRESSIKLLYLWFRLSRHSSRLDARIKLPLGTYMCFGLSVQAAFFET